MAVVLFFTMRGVCIFSWFADTVKYGVQCGICWGVIYWQCRLRCKIHTCCCQSFLLKYESLHCGSELFVCCFSWVSQRCNFLTAANVITAAGQTVTGCLCIYRIFINVEVNQTEVFVCRGAMFCTLVVINDWFQVWISQNVYETYNIIFLYFYLLDLQILK